MLSTGGVDDTSLSVASSFVSYVVFAFYVFCYDKESIMTKVAPSELSCIRYLFLSWIEIKRSWSFVMDCASLLMNCTLLCFEHFAEIVLSFWASLVDSSTDTLLGIVCCYDS